MRMPCSGSGLAVLALAFLAWPAAAQTWRVEPGAVVTGAQMLSPPKALRRPASGSFKLVADPAGAPGRTGGACLIALQGDACTTDADCSVNAARPSKPGNLGDARLHQGYCVPEVTIAPSGLPALGTCWVRPGPQSAYCRTSPLEPLAPNEVVRLPVVEGAYPKGARSTSWRVITCQNLKPGGCANAEAVDGVDRQYRYGPAQRVR